MAFNVTESTNESPEHLLKKLSVILSDNNNDLTFKIYEFIRGYLLDQKLNLNGSEKRNLFERNANTMGFDNYLYEQRVVKQYLESVNMKAAQQFNDFSYTLVNEKNMQNFKCLAPLRFLMALGKKKNSNEPIIVRETKSLPKLKSSKGRAPKPPDAENSNKSSSVTSFAEKKSTPDLNNYTSYSRAPINGFCKVAEMKSQESVLKCSRVSNLNVNHDVGGDLSEWDVIEGLLFVWQGIPSKIFRRCEKTLNYFLHEKWSVYPWIREQADNLASLGYLHDTLLPYKETPTDGGLIRKCLAGFVRDQLSEYYALIAAIRTEFQKESVNCNGDLSHGLTLERLRLQSAPVARTFMDLISIVEFTKDDKGGYLASGVFSFIRHGDPDLQCLVKAILAEICRPLYGMLTKWLLEGTLSDQSKEFFIAADTKIAGDRLWQEKYSIRLAMLPEFIPVQLAEKTLSVGRSINFLRERCNNEEPFAEKQKINNLFESRTAEVMYLSEESCELEHLVEEAYVETNKRVLDVLLTKYSLLNHFQAHRKFLLLGQGEFVYYLMDLLMHVLEKPASQLHPHYLNSILDSAVRATTAQFEPEDIINRLDAATLLHADGDNGWEVFYLRYHVDGPIGTVFSPSCRNEYQKLFCALWKAKRMEMILSKSWKHQIVSSKMLRKIGELGPVLRKCFELTAEMLHFVRQTQYYFLFEVLECEWNRLLEDVHLATNLDSVIDSHTEFLKKVTAGVFMDEKHKNLALQLRIIHDLVLSLVSHVEDFLLASEKEDQQRKLSGGTLAGLSAGEGSKVEYLQRRLLFINRFIPEATSRLRSLGDSYRRSIKKFLLTLNSEEDLNLQLLSVRLDFNSHYKQLDSRLEAPLTFEHRRMSSLTGELSPILTRKFSSVKRTIKIT